MAKIADLPGYFICPGCVQKDLESDEYSGSVAHLEPGKLVAGTRYCTLCAEEMLDELTIRVHYRLLKGRLSWGCKHSLSIALLAGIYEVTIKCPCWHHARPVIYSEPCFSGYWNLLASFVDAHYAQLKAIV
ncbi:MAG: hypothetical protein Q6370_012330 [Candidatus Sigynarchaeota archaeon]